MRCPTREAGHTQQLARQAVQAIQHAAGRRLQMHPLWVAGQLSLLLQEQSQLLLIIMSSSGSIELCNIRKARTLDAPRKHLAVPDDRVRRHAPQPDLQRRTSGCHKLRVGHLVEVAT